MQVKSWSKSVSPKDHADRGEENKQEKGCRDTNQEAIVARTEEMTVVLK